MLATEIRYTLISLLSVLATENKYTFTYACPRLHTYSRYQRSPSKRSSKGQGRKNTRPQSCKRKWGEITLPCHRYAPKIAACLTATKCSLATYFQFIGTAENGPAEVDWSTCNRYTTRPHSLIHTHACVCHICCDLNVKIESNTCWESYWVYVRRQFYSAHLISQRSRNCIPTFFPTSLSHFFKNKSVTELLRRSSSCPEPSNPTIPPLYGLRVPVRRTGARSSLCE